ncbi:MAG: GTP 3',8-cyclase MoaA [Deltaproteobacteria bacterium]|nr:GTP 3',8-cyclase MoaA [Deltaproteobacteria bacterium]
MEEEGGLRRINYLRMSITDRCNLRCVYCTYWQEWKKLPSTEILRYEELLRLAAVAAEAGIRKIRVTGGEPLARRGVLGFLHSLNQVPGIEEVCLTTNGIMLLELAPALYETGLRHLNLSLDTLRPERYRKITGRNKWREVMAGLESALSLGFQPLKINCVALQGINDDELVDLALLARDYPLQIRFIELMPSVSRGWWDRHFLPLSEVRRRLAVLGFPRPAPRQASAGPAQVFRLPGFKGELGFISPISEHHCRTCNRLRLTAAGQLRPCLAGLLELDIKGPLRRGAADPWLFHVFEEAIQSKNRDWRIPLRRCTFPAMAGMGG